MSTQKQLFILLLFTVSWLSFAQSANAQPTPEVKTYTVDGFPDRLQAVMIDLCTPDDPCSAISSIDFDVQYDTIFDLTNFQVHGLWLSPDGKVTTRIDHYPTEKRLHFALGRDNPVSGGGTLMKLPGIGIIDVIVPKRNTDDPAQTSELEELTVYPNPCKGTCYFNLKNNAQDASLSDIHGKSVWKAADLDPGKHTIPTNALQPGIYILHVITNGVACTSKILITPR